MVAMQWALGKILTKCPVCAEHSICELNRDIRKILILGGLTIEDILKLSEKKKEELNRLFGD